MYTDHQSTDDQCALMISVAPAVPPVSVHQCLPVYINATYQCPSEMPFSATYQCQTVPPTSVHQCTQCCLSVPPISAIYQCCLSVPISDACQCP
ncbi:unnamed protein product [Staurois parvus]|uniref:Uncharacterized protein n=1 Tax=Staurois parvus TaxID=386267 RepID=A0ABN9H3E3_9NEOB|nr:unnamed protein product [Staurois parvus]